MDIEKVRNLIFPWKSPFFRTKKEIEKQNTILWKAIEHDIQEIYLCIEGLEAKKADKRERPTKK